MNKDIDFKIRSEEIQVRWINRSGIVRGSNSISNLKFLQASKCFYLAEIMLLNQDEVVKALDVLAKIVKEGYRVEHIKNAEKILLNLTGLPLDIENGSTYIDSMKANANRKGGEMYGNQKE